MNAVNECSYAAAKTGDGYVKETKTAKNSGSYLACKLAAAHQNGGERSFKTTCICLHSTDKAFHPPRE